MNTRSPLVLVVLALLLAAPPARAQPLPTIAYQGYLEQSGAPLNNPSATLTFRLFNTYTGGTALWTETKTGVGVDEGLFDVALGSQVEMANTLFDGLLFLSVAVGGTSASQLSPRTVFRTVPYARTLSAPARIFGSDAGALLTVQNTTGGASGNGLYAETGAAGGRAVYGQAGSNSGAGAGVFGQSESVDGYGVFGTGPGVGVYGSGNSYGVYGSSPDVGVLGASPEVGVFGTASAQFSSGVFGESPNAGVHGQSPDKGVWGVGSAISGITYGVYGDANSSAGYAGYFNGRVNVAGTLTKGGGAFQIDHPLAPAERILRHSFVESPDMLNVYNGNVALDRRGEAVVVLPEWFEALNRDFRYQLTCIGGYAPIYVAEEVRGNRFRIGGGTPGLRVSWQVTGIRQDAWANANRIVVEEDKASEDRGHYLHPSAVGLPRAQGVDYDAAREARMEQARAAREAAPPPPPAPAPRDR